MSLADLRNNELIIVWKQWHLHHQSTLSGQFLLPAAALSYCSQQWKIITTEHNKQWTLFISVPLCLALFWCQSATITRWRSHLISLSPLFLVTYLYPVLSPSQTHSHTHSPGQKGGMWGIKLFKRLAESVAVNEHKSTSLHSQVCVYRLYGSQYRGHGSDQSPCSEC